MIDLLVVFWIVFGIGPGFLQYATVHGVQKRPESRLNGAQLKCLKISYVVNKVS